MRNWLHPVPSAIALLIAAAFFVEWRAERQDRTRLQAILSQAEQSLKRVTTSQQQRDRQLTDTLAKLESLKSTVKSQHRILATLPDVLPLPKPIVQSSATSDSAKETRPGNVLPAAPTPAILPPEDLKPLYDFALDCKACQAKLAAATADLADEKTKTQTLSRERDAAVKFARGGSLRQRLSRAFKWFVAGAIAGAVAARAH